MESRHPTWAAEWLAQWASAGPALEAERRARLAGLSGERAAAAVSAVLDLATTVPPHPERRATSGLVEQQALFAKTRRTGAR